MGDRTDRRCVGCGRDPGYNREIIDVVDGVVVGSLCRRCELAGLERLGVDSLQDLYQRERCVRCDRDGFFALPRWLPEASRVGSDLVTHVDYTLDDDVPHLCDEHYHELTTESTRTSPGARAPRERR